MHLEELVKAPRIFFYKTVNFVFLCRKMLRDFKKVRIHGERILAVFFHQNGRIEILCGGFIESKHLMTRSVWSRLRKHSAQYFFISTSQLAHHRLLLVFLLFDREYCEEWFSLVVMLYYSVENDSIVSGT